MELSEQINTSIKEALAAVKKAREINGHLNSGLKETKNLIHVSIDLNGKVVGINVPVSTKDLEPEEGVVKDDRPIGSFE